MDKLKPLLADRLAIQIDALTWNRLRLLRPYIIQGPVSVLNIGTGGGVQTLRLLRAGNRVTAIEVDSETARRTVERVRRNGFSDQFEMIEDHVLNVNLEGEYRVVWMTEVLEHIKDDRSTLERISSWLETGGRLVMSTPTASWGQGCGGEVSIEEDGGHVRVGYEGKELDLMLRDVGLVPIRRIKNGNRLTQTLHRFESELQNSTVGWPAGYALGLTFRPLLPVLDILSWGKWFNQITVAKKM